MDTMEPTNHWSLAKQDEFEERLALMRTGPLSEEQGRKMIEAISKGYTRERLLKDALTEVRVELERATSREVAWQWCIDRINAALEQYERLDR